MITIRGKSHNLARTDVKGCFKDKSVSKKFQITVLKMRGIFISDLNHWVTLAARLFIYGEKEQKIVLFNTAMV